MIMLSIAMIGLLTCIEMPIIFVKYCLKFSRTKLSNDWKGM